MKITDEHYGILSDACNAVLIANPEAKEKYKAMGFSDERFRWDVLYAAMINGERSYRFITDVLYAYLNDKHIATALRKIIA